MMHTKDTSSRATRPAWRQTLRENWILLLVFVFLLLFPFIVGWLTGSSPFGVMRGTRIVMRGESVRWQSVMIEVFIFAVLTMSYNLLFGFTGVISFGHALFFGLGGYVLGIILQFTGMESSLALIVGMIIGMTVCGLLSLLMGLATLRLRGVYFAIFTLAVAEMAFIFFGRLPLTRAEDGIALDKLPVWIDPAQNRLTFYYLMLAIFVLTFLFIRRLVNSPTGAVFKAIRENEERAQAIGFNTLNYKLLAITVAGTLAALAGMFQAMINKKIGPELLAVNNTVEPLLMSIIGGIGTFVGPVIGASGLHLLDVFFRDLKIPIGNQVLNISDIWGLLLGLIFIAVVIIFPQGVVGTWQRWRQRDHRS